MKKAPPKWNLKQESFETIHNVTISLKCDAFSIPSATYKWLKNGIQINNERYKVDANNSLIINDLVLADASKYTCIAENNLGRIENEFYLKVLSKFWYFKH